MVLPSLPRAQRAHTPPTPIPLGEGFSSAPGPRPRTPGPGSGSHGNLGHPGKLAFIGPSGKLALGPGTRPRPPRPPGPRPPRRPRAPGPGSPAPGKHSISRRRWVKPFGSSALRKLNISPCLGACQAGGPPRRRPTGLSVRYCILASRPDVAYRPIGQMLHVGLMVRCCMLARRSDVARLFIVDHRSTAVIICGR